MTNADQAASPVYTPAVHRPAVVFDARASSEKDATVDDNKKRRDQKNKEKKKRQREEKKAADAAAKYGPLPADSASGHYSEDEEDDPGTRYSKDRQAAAPAGGLQRESSTSGRRIQSHPITN